jgi:uncharacterized membrane protein
MKATKKIIQILTCWSVNYAVMLHALNVPLLRNVMTAVKLTLCAWDAEAPSATALETEVRVTA